MPNRCIVAGCSNTPKDDVSLHRFPKDENLRKLWISKVKLTRADWRGPSDWSTICSDHFSAEDFEDTGLYSSFGMKVRSKLIDSAVPTIRLGVKPSKKQDVPTRSAVEKRERKRILEEALSETTALDSPVSGFESFDEPGCSHWSTASENEESLTTELTVPSVECETDLLDEPACSYWITKEI
ncbi:THAP domain-containing protein 10-like [Lytechinus pictus]|uniref:THAP domain-containing protein 10-like n=1 Tax=Lytechinus pictus TaxID=7653 RepID=UPI00240DAC3A|nr:THAP domain-containing protein 10-like [Lytechinus pictus]